MRPILSILALFLFLLLPVRLPGQENVLTVRTPHTEVTNVTQLNETNAQTNIQYFDTAGRLVQNVRKKFSPTGGDLADYILYDSLGCKVAEYFPQPFQDNQGVFLPEAAFSEINGWKKTYRYESSVKHRIIAAGGLHYGGREVGYSYRLNHSSVPELSVFRLTLSGDNLQCNQATDGLYHVTETCDEDGHRVLVFSDNYGRNMVTRKINESEFYDTYYLYDLLDRSVCVLPPAAVTGFASRSSYSLAAGSLPFLYCYRYEYDGRNRKTGIKCPGADWKYIIYDGEDRPVMTQSGNQRAHNEWSFIKYDGLDRVILQGTVRDSRSRYFIASEWEEVAVQEKFIGTGNCLGYSDSRPLGDGKYTVTTANFYDNYDFTDLSRLGISRPEAPLSTHGLLTGRYEAVLNSPGKGRTSLFRYDAKARITEESSYNSLTEKSVNHKLSYNYSGLPVKEEYIYNDSIRVTYTHEYDHGLRKTTTLYNVTGINNASDPLFSILSAKKYNEKGHLSESRSFHEKTRTTYSYYTDETLREISNGNGFTQTLYKGGDGTLPYDLSRCYNGNINDISVAQQGKQAIWHYEYDELDRLLSGINYSSYAYQTPLGEKEFFTYDRMGNITQLLRDHRKVHVSALFATYTGNQLVKAVDGGIQNTDYDYQTYPDLADEEQEYYYDANGNQVTNLDKDIVTVRYNHLNLPDTVQMGNGNRIIHYYLSGGERIRTVSRTYTTALSVPRDVVTGSNDPHIESVETRLGNLIYKNGTPDRLLCQEGYWEIRKNSASGVQEFHPFAYICDYLGSVRLVYDGITGTVVQSLEYLPSGLICSSTNYDLQSNKFTGKELLSMHGLNQYDSKARMQEFQLPGFTTQDPLCEKYYDWTPYGYCMGNPINAVDPGGKLVIFINGMHTGNGGTKKYWEGIDNEVMDRIKDWNADYIDGSVGGTNGIFTNISVEKRYNTGYERGKEYAKYIIFAYQNDDGSFKESIKIITHSMGAAYAKGFIKGLIEAGVPLNIIEFEADFAPFQPTKQKAVNGVRTFQFSHENDWVANNSFLGSPARKIEGVADSDYSSVDDPNKDHKIVSFWNDVSNLPEGKYKVVNGKIVY